MGILIAILVFSFIVIFHELGHFTLAKLNGIEVEEFSLGLGPTIFGKEFHGTKFSLKLLPFGGACFMDEDDVENLSEGSFNSKSVWARISVIAAGPVFNFILAFILSLILVGWIGYDEPVVGKVLDGYSAQEQGLHEGDRIVEINGDRIHLWREISLHTLMHPGEADEVVYERDGQKYEVTLVSQKDENGKYIRRERYYGNCSRSFYVGENITQEDIKARFEDGILKIVVPKKEAKPAVEEKKYISIEG